MAHVLLTRQRHLLLHPHVLLSHSADLLLVSQASLTQLQSVALHQSCLLTEHGCRLDEIGQGVGVGVQTRLPKLMRGGAVSKQSCASAEALAVTANQSADVRSAVVAPQRVHE